MRPAILVVACGLGLLLTFGVWAGISVLARCIGNKTPL
jgi:hypothetical protein